MHGGEPPVLAEVVRSGLVESQHHGSIVVLDSSGQIDAAVGAFDRPMYPRSTSKPGQATAMVRLGLPLDGQLLALSASSHSGEDFHIAGVRRILAAAGLSESKLQNTPDWPLSTPVMLAYAQRGFTASSISADCSGKHAAMLATCVANGWSVDDYLEPAHPLQDSIHTTLEELTGESITHTSVDGCGAPLFALTLVGVATMMRTLALAEAGSHEWRVADAIRKHPEWTSGSDRDEARLIRAVPGLIAKAGAEAVYGLALPDGRAVAIKIADGGPRARRVVMAAVLRWLGVDHPVLDDVAHVPVLGGGKEVGEIRATLPI